MAIISRPAPIIEFEKTIRAVLNDIYDRHPPVLVVSAADPGDLPAQLLDFADGVKVRLLILLARGAK